MDVTNIDFNQPPRLMINGTEYTCDNIIKGSFHIFNKSQMKFKNIWYKDNRNVLDNFIKFPSFCLVELYYGNKLAFFGVNKRQTKINLNPMRPKFIDMTVIDFKEWLNHKPMDFIIYKKSPEWVVNEIVKTLGENKIKVGTLDFTTNDNIVAYNTKDKTAYDVLRMIEKKTQSILEIKNNGHGELTINFFTEDSIIKHNRGVELDLSTNDKIEAFNNSYEITEFEIEESTSKYANQVRVESEKALFDTEVIVQIDLSTISKNYTLNKPIGQIIKNKTGMFDNGSFDRRLSIVTKDQADKGKSFDISYAANSNVINFGDKLIGQNKFIRLVYLPIGRISYQFDNLSEQQRIASISKSNGIVHRYEKHNDETTPTDMILLGKGYLEKNKKPGITLKIKSYSPIWNLGESTVLKTKFNNDIDGIYVAYEFNINQTITPNGSVLNVYEYELLNTLDFETHINKYDSQKYRDNPIINASDIEFDTRTDIQENILLTVENWTCDGSATDKLYPELEGD